MTDRPAGVASIKDTYTGTVELTDLVEPSSLVLTVAGSGASGTVAATVNVAFSDNADGTTGLRYDADATVGGMIGGVGQRMLSGVSRRMAGQFFGAVDGVLTGRTRGGGPAGDSRSRASLRRTGTSGGPCGPSRRGFRPRCAVRRCARAGRGVRRGVARSAAGLRMPPRRLRIGVDTGGTFTDVVAFDETLASSPPPRPRRPRTIRPRASWPGSSKILGLLGAGPEAVAAVSHGTTVATNQLLQGEVGRLGFITTEGYRVPAGDRPAVRPGRLRQLLLLGQARPDRAGGAGPHRAPDGWTTPGPSCARSTPTRPARWPAGSASGASPRSASASCTPTPTRRTSEQMREILAQDHPDAVVSISSQVLPEYREYERAMTTLVDAAVKPTVSRYVAAIARRLNGYAGPVPFSVMKIQRRGAQRRRGGAPADHDRAVRARCRRTGCRADRRPSGLRQGADLRRRWHVHRCLGGGRRAARR